MAFTPITAPTPSIPSPWYALTVVTVSELLNPNSPLFNPNEEFDFDNFSVLEEAWGILCEESGELLTSETNPEQPWLAKTRACAVSHIRYLNGITAEFPTCLCQS